MEIKLGKLVGCIKALAILHRQKGMGSVTAYRIMKNWDTVTQELKYFDKQKVAICEKYGKKDKDGKLIVEDGKCTILIKHAEEYKDEMEALLNEVVDIPIKKISLSSIDCAGLAPEQLAAIDFILENEE